MKIKWYGHSAFLIETENGTRILTDPCAPTTGYELNDIACDIVTSSHSHYDHNYFVAAAGTPEILSQEGEYEINGVKLRAIRSYHDEEHGALRGTNLIFTIEADGMRLVHLGDLGHLLSPELADEIGVRPDVLMCPVGGTYTINGTGACNVSACLHPNIVIPMHYQTEALTLSKPIAGVDDFLRNTRASDIQRQNSSECVITKETLPNHCRVIVLSYDKD
ncbi:MAG: MBL fold metallo-hydrolase [Clostridia bacterium]|nr:MBL fold metallo-hydrolase [Clostridia bacterium]